MLNEALKYIRMFHKLKQNELADTLGKPRSYISEIESGKRAVTLDLLQHYSKAFNIPVSSLMLFSEQLESNKTSEKIRFSAANKIVKIFDWVFNSD